MSDQTWPPKTRCFAECERDEFKARITELEAQVAEHETRWDWLTRSIEAISGDGFFSWASPVLAVIKKCRYENLEETK